MQIDNSDYKIHHSIRKYIKRAGLDDEFFKLKD